MSTVIEPHVNWMVARKTTPTLFGETLRRIRESRNMTQSRLSMLSGVERSYISRMESGDRDVPTRPVVDALADPLEATPYERVELMADAGYVPDGLAEFTKLFGRLRPGLQVQIVELIHAMTGAEVEHE